MDSDAEVPPGHTAAELLPSLLDLLGENDPFLRDEVGYGVLARWVVQDQLLGADELRYAVERLVPDLRIGLDDSDAGDDAAPWCGGRTRRWRWPSSPTATSRTTSSTPDEVHRLLDAAIAYLLDETDRRGYVPELGWINATAHAADLLKFLVRNPLTDESRPPARARRAADAAHPAERTGVRRRRGGPPRARRRRRDRPRDDQRRRAVRLDRRASDRGWPARPGAFDPASRAAAVNLKRFVRTLHLALCSRAHRRG